MSLDFEFVPTIDRKLIEYTKSDGSLHWTPRAQSFVFFQMQLQHSLEGEMTGKKLEEINRRISLINLLDRRPYYYDIDGNAYQHQINDVVTYWGLSTNVSHLTKTKWNKWYLRVCEYSSVKTPIHKLIESPYEIYITNNANTN